MKLALFFPLMVVLPACTSTSSTTKLNPKDTERKMIGLEEKFDRFDTDGNGYLTGPELRAGLKTVDVPDATPERVKGVIDYYDANNDGRISLRETQSATEAGPDALIKKLN